MFFLIFVVIGPYCDLYWLCRKLYLENVYFITIFFFFSKEFFTNDSELIIIICILSFIIFFYYNFRFLLYNAFFFRMKSLKMEYINFLILNQNVQNNIIYLSKIFYVKENLIIKILSYVFFFLKFDYISQTFYKKIFIYYLFKEKLIFFINEFCSVNDTKFLTVLSSFFFKFFMFLKNFNLTKDSSKNACAYIFDTSFRYEIYFKEKNLFSLNGLWVNHKLKFVK